MRALEPDAFSEAVLIGAKRYGHESGHTYRRRQLTSKQRKLIALLADGDAAGTDELTKAFPDEWNAIITAHPDREMTLQHQALFENLADVVSRINAYLLAGYKDTILRARMAALLGDQLAAIGTTFADREMWTVGAGDLSELLPVMTVTQAYRKRARSTAPVPPTPQPHPEPEPPPVQDPPTTPAPTEIPPNDRVAESPPTQDPSQMAAHQETPRATPDPAPPMPPQAREAPPDTIAATVNPVTLRWILYLPEGEIEADPRLATVRSGSSIRPWQGEPLPEDPEALTAEQLALLRKMVS